MLRDTKVRLKGPCCSSSVSDPRLSAGMSYPWAFQLRHGLKSCSAGFVLLGTNPAAVLS